MCTHQGPGNWLKGGVARVGAKENRPAVGLVVPLGERGKVERNLLPAVARPISSPITTPLFVTMYGYGIVAPVFELARAKKRTVSRAGTLAAGVTWERLCFVRSGKRTVG